MVLLAGSALVLLHCIMSSQHCWFHSNKYHMLTYLSVTVAQMISNHTNLNEANFAADKKKQITLCQWFFCIFWWNLPLLLKKYSKLFSQRGLLETRKFYHSSKWFVNKYQCSKQLEKKTKNGNRITRTDCATKWKANMLLHQLHTSVLTC